MSKLRVESQIKVGNIVRVVSEYVDGRFFGKQAEVIEIRDDKHEDGPLCLRFPKWYKNLFSYPDKPETIVRFQINEVEPCHDWDKISIKQELNLIFGTMWYYYRSKKHPFTLGYSDCDYDGCSDRALIRGYVNCHGTVSIVDLCKKHLEWHGRNCDTFPHKKD